MQGEATWLRAAKPKNYKVDPEGDPEKQMRLRSPSFNWYMVIRDYVMPGNQIMLKYCEDAASQRKLIA